MATSGPWRREERNWASRRQGGPTGRAKEWRQGAPDPQGHPTRSGADGRGRGATRGTALAEYPNPETRWSASAPGGTGAATRQTGPMPKWNSRARPSRQFPRPETSAPRQLHQGEVGRPGMPEGDPSGDRGRSHQDRGSPGARWPSPRLPNRRVAQVWLLTLRPAQSGPVVLGHFLVFDSGPNWAQGVFRHREETPEEAGRETSVLT